MFLVKNLPPCQSVRETKVPYANSKLAKDLTGIRIFLHPGQILTRIKICINPNQLFLFQRAKLLEARQKGFNDQLEKLAEPIGSLAEKSKEVYEGKISILPIKNHVISKGDLSLSLHVISFFFLDIPEESPILNLDKMVNLDTSQLHTETTG